MRQLKRAILEILSIGYFNKNIKAEVASKSTQFPIKIDVLQVLQLECHIKK